MRDLFDDFLKELERRQADAFGRPKGPRPVNPDPDDDADGSEDPDGPSRSQDRGSGDDGPPRRPRPRRSRGANEGRRIVGTWALILVVLGALFLGSLAVTLWTDVLWFGSIGFVDVLWTRIGSQAALFALGGVGAIVLLLLNLLIASRLTGQAGPGGGDAVRNFFARFEEASASGFGQGQRGPRPVNAEPMELPDLGPIGTWALVGVAALSALGLAGALAGQWETVQLWLNRVPFASGGAAVTDPIFGRDISFFLFELPFLRLLQSVANSLLVASLLVAGGRYVVGALGGKFNLSTPVRVHLGILAGLFLLTIAMGYQLDKFDLAYSDRGFATGVSYTDQTAQFMAFDILTVLSGLAAALLVGAAFTRWVWPLGMTVTVWFLASLVVGRLYPEAIQRITVDPNQYAQEAPYIDNNIRMTRLAFGLDRWDDTRRYSGDALLSADVVSEEDATFANARLWDYRPLGDTLDQLQTVRRYYDFYDVDTDRYVIDGEQRQVMLSARELDLAGNPNATGWVNQRVIYTHGTGVTMVPVNDVANDGQPRLFIKNLPPVSSDGAPEVTQPAIYFGEAPSHYIVVGAKQAEFDYPRGGDATGDNDASAAVEARWAGTTGIPLGTTFDRLLFAARFGDLNLLISDQVTSDSKVLFRRTLSERLDLLAPFLLYDKDPYVVIYDGKLVYVQDAYTTSDRFPHSDYFAPGDLGAGSGLGLAPFNYIRNSVKITMDAYDGTMRFYVSDSSDPVVRAYSAVFPTLFQSIDTLPSDLRSHLRVPEELFNVQTRMFGSYHVTNSQTFFQQDDLWTVPTGQTNEKSLPSEAYYVIMRMPGEAEAEFLLLQPMVPKNRPNMIAWIAARNDDPNYGDVRVYRFPADTTVFGPAQIEARIDQDPVISAQVTLWDQSGSSVIRGNLIVIPVGNTLLYLQPVYLQSTNAAFPEFQRIVLASPRQVVWGESLGEALNLLLRAEGSGLAPTPTPGPGATPAPTPIATPNPTPGDLPADVAGLITYANLHFERAQEALRDGDFARYGTEIQLVEQALQRLGELTGTPSPVP